jgi:ankyrin repeat protein
MRKTAVFAPELASLTGIENSGQGGDMLGQKMLNETSQGNVKAVQRLISRGVDVNTTNRYGVTPLMVACLCNWPEVVKLLLDKGADAERRESFFGCTALMFACMSGGWDSVKLLLDRGADVNATDSLQRTALTVAHSVDNEEAAKLLLQRGAKAQESNTGRIWQTARASGRKKSRSNGSSPVQVGRTGARFVQEPS